MRPLGDALALGPLAIQLEDLSVGIPFDYRFGLRGLDASFDGGPVAITSAFLESREGGVVQYTGAAMITAEAFSITGIGSYAAIGGLPRCSSSPRCRKTSADPRSAS